MQETKRITEYRKQLRLRILEYALSAFSRRGIKAVKMDDIADGLQISKRTLYEIYSTKEELLFEGIRTCHEEYNRKIKEYARCHGSNVMETVLYAFNCHMVELGSICPDFISDVQKYPEISKYFASKKEEQLNDFRSLLRQGINEGYFRSDFNFELLESVINGFLDAVHGMHLYEKYSMKEVFYTVVQIIFRAICTPKGLEELDKFKLQ